MSNVLVFIHIIAYNISISKMLNDIINEEVQNVKMNGVRSWLQNPRPGNVWLMF